MKLNREYRVAVAQPSTLHPQPVLVGYPSGQRGQTVNLLAYAFDGSNPSPTTIPFPKGILRFQPMLMRQSSIILASRLDAQPAPKALPWAPDEREARPQAIATAQKG